MQVGVGKGRYSRLSPCLISSVHPSLPVHPLVYTSKCTIELIFVRLSSESRISTYSLWTTTRKRKTSCILQHTIDIYSVDEMAIGSCLGGTKYKSMLIPACQQTLYYTHQNTQSNWFLNVCPVRVCWIPTFFGQTH